MPAPQHEAAPLRVLLEAAMTLPSLGGIGAARLAGRGAQVPHVPAPQHDIAPLRALLSGAIFFPSLGGSGSGRPPGRAAIALAVGAAVAVGSALTSALATAVGSAVGIAVASAVADVAGADVPPCGFSADGEPPEQPMSASVSVAEIVFASSIQVLSSPFGPAITTRDARPAQYRQLLPGGKVVSRLVRFFCASRGKKPQGSSGEDQGFVERSFLHRIGYTSAMSVACVFCEILQGRVPAFVVLDEPSHLAFLDIRPLFAGHVLLVPRAHIETLSDVPEEAVPPLFLAAQRLARAVERGLGAEGTFVAMNNRVSQSVPHLHVHIVPRKKKDGLKGFFWPRTKYASDEAAREAQGRIVAALG